MSDALLFTLGAIVGALGCWSFMRNFHAAVVRASGPIYKCDVAELNLGPNDRIVITTDAVLSQEQREYLRNAWAYAVRHNRAIVLDGGMRVMVIRGLV